MNESLPAWMKLKDDDLYYTGADEFIFFVSILK